MALSTGVVVNSADTKQRTLIPGERFAGEQKSSAPVELCATFPSIARWGVGRALGRLYESLPMKIGTAKLSYLLFCLPTAPVAAGLWVLAKLIGERYVVTTATVERRRSIGDALVARVAMADVAEVRVTRQPWEAVFRTGTVSLVDATGRDVMVLEGVSDPECFAGTIREAVTSGRTIAASLAQIAARRNVAPPVE